VSPETLALLFAADRTDHLAAEIRRLTASGVAVVCDRYALSSIAYQGQELDPSFVRAINAKATPPDLTLYVRVSPETALRRRSGRHLGDELYEKLETQRRVAARYDAAAEAEREAHHVVTIDGEQGIEAVAADCLAAIRPLLDAAR
jgi:dTMP kinase